MIFVEIFKNKVHRRGEARSLLLLRDLTGTWEPVKTILEEIVQIVERYFTVHVKSFIVGTSRMRKSRAWVPE